MELTENETKFHKIILTITRHGETQQNKSKTICGQQPGKLTQLGKKQAQKIGDYFLQEKPHFDYIYVSDLQRTKDTFTNIKIKAKYLEHIPTTYTKDLRQKAGGILQGKPLTAWKQQADKQHKHIRQYKCKNGQSWQDVNRRVYQFFKNIIQTHITCTKKQKEKLKIQQSTKIKPQKKEEAKKEQLKLKVQSKKQQKSQQTKLSEQLGKLSVNQEKEINILAVSHGGYIMQMHNVHRNIGLKLPAVINNSAQNCSIHKFQIKYPVDASQYNPEHIKMQCLVDNFTAHMK